MNLQEHAEIDRYFADVAAHMSSAYGGSWTFRPSPPDWNPGGRLVDEESGMVLYATISQDKRESFQIKAEAPKDSRGQVPYVAEHGRPSINVSWHKGPETTAREVARRLVPEWLPTFQKALEQIERSDQHESSSTGLAAKIARTVGVRQSEHDAKNHRVRFYDSPRTIFAETGSDAEIRANEVTLTLVLSGEDALALLEYMIGKVG
jgi:hypothetical protein